MIELFDINTIFNAEEFIKWFTQNANYIFVFCFMVIESSFIPFPSELVVPPAAFLAAQRFFHPNAIPQGIAGCDMNIFIIVLAATAGALVGAIINYYLSMWIGRPLVYRFADTRLAHGLLIDRTKVEKAERYFDKYGAVSTFIGRLIPVIRQYISIPAGLAKMNIGIFAIFTSLGALIWNAILALMGFLIAKYYNINDLYAQVEHYNTYLTWGGLALLLLCVAYILWNAFKKK